MDEKESSCLVEYKKRRYKPCQSYPELSDTSGQVLLSFPTCRPDPIVIGDE